MLVIKRFVLPVIEFYGLDQNIKAVEETQVSVCLPKSALGGFNTPGVIHLSLSAVSEKTRQKQLSVSRMTTVSHPGGEQCNDTINV